MDDRLPILNAAEIRVLESQEDKAALIKFKYEKYSLAEVCRELKADTERRQDIAWSWETSVG